MFKDLKITFHEEKIILLLRKGYTNEYISHELGRSLNTVKYHLKKIYRKLGVKNRIEAINEFNKHIKSKKL